MKCALFLLVLLGISEAQKSPECPPVCDLSACPKVSDSCIAETSLDSCDCCTVCSKVLHESCGGEFWRGGKCGVDYICVGNSPMKEVTISDNERGECQCRNDEKICGSDATLYPNSCAFHAENRRREIAGEALVTNEPDSDLCKYAAIINTPPKDTNVYSGQQVYLSCEVEGNPMPDITWYQNGKKMPGYRNNISVQIRGGHGKHRETSWIMIDTREEDSGVYQCHASNKLGDVSREATVLVSPRPEIPEQVPQTNDQDLLEDQPVNQI